MTQSTTSYSNRHNLPEPVAAVLTADMYTKGQANASVTGLMSPPRVRLLARSGSDEDVIDRVWSSMGTAWHAHAQNILSQYDPNYIVEERYFTTISGWVVSGQVDLQVPQPDGSIWIYDWKVTTSSKIAKGYSAEWEKQLNCYAYLVQKCTGKKVTRARVVAILRDHKRNLFRKAKDGDCSIKIYDMQLWPFQQQEAYLKQRVKIHQEAEADWMVGDSLPECTYEEQWRDADRYAVVPKGKKRAVKIHDTFEQAEEHAEQLGNAIVAIRYGAPKKCEANYCGVARNCDQRQRETLVMISTRKEGDDPYAD